MSMLLTRTLHVLTRTYANAAYCHSLSHTISLTLSLSLVPSLCRYLSISLTSPVYFSEGIGLGHKETKTDLQARRSISDFKRTLIGVLVYSIKGKRIGDISSRSSRNRNELKSKHNKIHNKIHNAIRKRENILRGENFYELLNRSRTENLFPKPPAEIENIAQT